MKLPVPVKRVIDFNVNIRAKANDSDVEIANVKMSMNPFDEIAIEEAIRFKEAGQVTEVVAVSIGPSQAQETLRTALAMGVDRAILAKVDDVVEPLSVAKLLKGVVEVEGPGLLILGKQAIDDDCNQTGQMLSALLGWAQAAFASKLELGDKKARITREIDGGLQTIEVALPVIVTADLRLNEPRYASFVENVLSVGDRPELSSAKIIISGGCALGSREKLDEVILPVAGKLGAAVDAGYVPNDWQVGQTDKIVAQDFILPAAFPAPSSIWPA